MTHVFAKLRIRGNSNKYRKVLSTKDDIYSNIEYLIIDAVSYNPGAKLDTGEWFMIPEFSKQRFSIDITSGAWETVDYDSLKKEEYGNIDFLFAKNDNGIFFQRVTKAKLVRKKHIWEFGGKFRYVPDAGVLALNDYPDAIYVPQKDVLYFQRFETASIIFKGMAILYREATDQEVKEFLSNSFITLMDGFETDKVKKTNRKLIAQAVDQFSNMKQEDREKIFSYIKEYCPNLSVEDQQFAISSNKDLKMLLYGIGQRFYTTPVGDEQRVANSTITLNL